MNKRNLKLYAVPVVYTCVLFVFVVGMYIIGISYNKSKFSKIDNMEYVDKEIVTDNEYIPVVASENTIMMPFTNSKVTKSKSFYDYQDEKEKQENSIILYEDTYIQNTGVDYTATEPFDITSIYDGKVIEVTDNEILGKTIKIQHKNNLISVYQSLSQVSVKVDDNIIRGQKIGISGTSRLYDKDFNLHFELLSNGQNINPENSYNKTIEELGISAN